MATFSFEAAALTSALPTDWALRMRVNRSAMGSLMLIGSPTCLAQPRDLTAHRRFAQLGAGQAELAVHPARAAGNLAAVAHADGIGIARQGLQLGLRDRAGLR